MRNKYISFIAATGLIFGTVTTLLGETKPAYKVKFGETPPAVQAGVRAFAGKAEIDDVDKKMRDGKNYYNVAFKKNGKHTETWFGEDGTLLAVAEGAGTPLKQFPDPVLKTLKAQLGGSHVSDFTPETVDGKKFYHFGFKQGGKFVHVKIDSSGALIHKNDKPLPAASAAAPGAVATTPTPAAPGPIPAPPPAVSGKVTFDQVPAAVQNTVKAQINPSEINDIDREVKPGKQTVYEVGFKRNGQQTELRINEDGTMEQK